MPRVFGRISSGSRRYADSTQSHGSGRVSRGQHTSATRPAGGRSSAAHAQASADPRYLAAGARIGFTLPQSAPSHLPESFMFIVSDSPRAVERTIIFDVYASELTYVN